MTDEVIDIKRDTTYEASNGHYRATVKEGRLSLWSRTYALSLIEGLAIDKWPEIRAIIDELAEAYEHDHMPVHTT